MAVRARWWLPVVAAVLLLVAGAVSWRLAAGDESQVEPAGAVATEQPVPPQRPAGPGDKAIAEGSVPGANGEDGDDEEEDSDSDDSDDSDDSEDEGDDEDGDGDGAAAAAHAPDDPNLSRIELALKDERGPVARAAVMLDEHVRIRSDGAGLAAFTRVRPGEHHLTVRADGYFDPPDVAVVTDPGATARVQVELRKGAALEGVVVTRGGGEVANAIVYVTGRAQRAFTDATGHFQLRPFEPGEKVEIGVTLAGYRLARPVSAAAGDPPLRIEVEELGVFTGRVLADGGTPITRFRVQQEYFESPDGRFSIKVTTTPNGKAFANVGADGYRPIVVTRPLDAGTFGDVVLDPLPSIEVLIVDRSGAPVPDAEVSCEGCGPAPMRSGADGRLRFVPTRWNAGSLDAHRGDAWGHERLLLVREIKIVLSPPAVLHGRTGSGLEMKLTPFYPPKTSIALAAGTDGRYQAAVPANDYWVRVPDRSGAKEHYVRTWLCCGDRELNLGPGSGRTSLTLRAPNMPGSMLFLVAGQLTQAEIDNAFRGAAQLWAPSYFVGTPYSQVWEEPTAGAFPVDGLAPGPYTILWLKPLDPEHRIPVVRYATIPGTAEVAIGP
ncbi:MAG TPA: carboxypeptidase regulatory-like domain-containing protein [Myxococcaceae bacterium]|jgi:hypothetical protein